METRVVSEQTAALGEVRDVSRRLVLIRLDTRRDASLLSWMNGLKDSNGS